VSQKGTSVILSDSEGSAFAASPRETNSRSFAVAQDDKGFYDTLFKGKEIVC
jgi:hypothetical protein